MDTTTATIANMQLDQQKFAEEAAKRKRADGLAQFEELHHSQNDRLRHLADDPFIDHAALDKQEPALHDGDHTKFLIVGAGMGGILNAVKLVKAGFSADQIRLVDVAGGIGGTWYWNRYPGLHCDVEAYVYLPLLEDMGYMPKKKYVSAVEIRNYLISMARKYNIENKIQFRTQIDELRWDDDKNLWKVEMTTARGQRGQETSALSIDAQFVILGTGLFPRPQVPKLPGLTEFQGHMFHTARWNYEISGGSSEDPYPVLSGLEGKRVGIIGTGATAVQVIPEVAKYAKDVYIFQRTPSQVFARNQRETDPTEWQEKIASKPGWQKERMENIAEFVAMGGTVPGKENLVGDAWSTLPAYNAIVGSSRFGTIAPDKVPQHIGTLLTLDAESSARVRARVSELVHKKDTAEKLTPWYPTWCKRPTFSDIFLQAFNQDHVHLVDTDGKGVEAATPRGLVANGQEYPLDILILSTGYRTPAVGGGNPAVRSDFGITGREGQSLTDKWTAQGSSTLHGCSTSAFPNLFWMGPSQTGATANFAHVLDALSTHIVYILREAHQRGGGPDAQGVVVEVTPLAEEKWGMEILKGAAFFAGIAPCTPSYVTSEGEATAPGKDPAELVKSGKGSPYAAGMVPYVRTLEAWRDEGKLDGYSVQVAACSYFERTR
ncbi:hypothetical protein BX600DRAFT_532607 [Xylariales sp. PMI_506]|nr:hypothetical protein BX600DRAFT_532607 [Xylariales sp. PMI_506]